MSNSKTTPVREFRDTKGISGTEGNVVKGYFAKFNKLSSDLGGFREQLSPGCFTDSLRTQPMLALVDHDSSKVIGNSKSGTLRAWEDDTGLAFELILPNTTYANDLKESLKRKDVTGCSFGFFCDSDSWSQLKDGTPLRTVRKATCFEGTICSMPAYLDSEASLRTWFPDGTKHLKLTQRDTKQVNTALLTSLLLKRLQG